MSQALGHRTPRSSFSPFFPFDAGSCPKSLVNDDIFPPSMEIVGAGVGRARIVYEAQENAALEEAPWELGC